jgi:glycosyltransferase involved in cell wall biosynthesis
MLRQIDVCIAISRDLEAEFETAGIEPKKIHFLPNGVDTERFRPARPEEKVALRKQLNLPTERPLALYVGVFDTRKNIQWLMEQWHTENGFSSNAMLVAVGPQSRDDTEGRFRQSLLDLAATRPDLLAVVEPTDAISDYYRAADLFILPSHREGLPNALLEAMASGLLAVAADASGTRELVHDGETGFLFALDDAEELAQAVNKALAPTSADLGTAARDLIQQQYSVKQLASRYEALYTTLFAEPG